jgi:ankyrin repeat protein
MQARATRTFVEAAHYGHVETMKRLFEYVRDVNVMGTVVDWGTIVTGTALYQASREGKLEAVRWLLAQEGIDVNLGCEKGYSPLIIAISRSHDAVAMALIAAGADVNHRNSWSSTALMFASIHGDTTIMRRLIAAGARVNDVRRCGFTALDRVPNLSHEARKLLLAHRALPGTGKPYPYHPWLNIPPPPSLHRRPTYPSPGVHFTLAPEEGTPEALAWTDAFGRTALHYAALAGNHTAYAVLEITMRRAGVDTGGADGGGYTALDHLVR